MLKTKKYTKWTKLKSWVKPHYLTSSLI